MRIVIILLFFTVLPISITCAERKRSSSDLWSNEHFDFCKYRQKFVQEVVIDGVFQGVSKIPPAIFQMDHCYVTLHDAAAANDPKGIELLLADPKHKKYLDGFDIDGQTPLQVAIDFGAYNAITCLMSNGACVDTYNRENEYTAWTLAKAYFEAKTDMNVVPFQMLQEELAKRGELEKHLQDDEKKYKEEKKARLAAQRARVQPVPEKPSRKVYLRRRSVRSDLNEPMPRAQEEPSTPPYDEYMLNV